MLGGMSIFCMLVETMRSVFHNTVLKPNQNILIFLL
jgi:RIO kinase 1